LINSEAGGATTGNEDTIRQGDAHFEVGKHITTLSAGATVLIGTFMKDIFPKTETGSLNLSNSAKLMLFVSIAALTASTIFAVIALLPRWGNWSSNFPNAVYPSTVFFIVGVALFALVVYLSMNVPETFREDPKAVDPTISAPVTTPPPVTTAPPPVTTPPPPPEPPECVQIRSRIGEIDQQIAGLSATLEAPKTPAVNKSGIMQQIDQLQSERATVANRSAEIGCSG
jgi:hypothetical protein